MKKAVDFFMGANSGNGFFSFYDELKEPREKYRSYLIKGGAGTGKSRLMNKLASEFMADEGLLEHIHCSSDPNSLDGVILHDAKCSIVDATPPHVIEPSYPGAYETVINLCEFFDEKKLSERILDIEKYQEQNQLCHKRCRGLIKCADILQKDNEYYAEKCTDYDKLLSATARICKAELKSQGKKGVEHKRLLSAVTNQGIVTYKQTASKLCEKLYVIKDEYGAVSSSMLAMIKKAALENGYEVFACYCPLSPDYKIEHLFIIDAGIGFVTENRYTAFDGITADKVISYKRFTDCEKLKDRKQLLRFNRRASDELLNAAVYALKEAKVVHDKLEAQYTDCVDFEKVNQKSDEIYMAIKKRYS